MFFGFYSKAQKKPPDNQTAFTLKFSKLVVGSPGNLRFSNRNFLNIVCSI